MPFINPAELAAVELFPQINSGLVAGERLMLSFLDMEEGCEVPEHSHPHEQAGLVLAGRFRFRIGAEEARHRPGRRLFDSAERGPLGDRRRRAGQNSRHLQSAARGLHGAIQQIRPNFGQNRLGLGIRSTP